MDSLNTETVTPEQWAIVEIFGHARIAGRLSEQTIGGCSFVRVDVPDLPGEKGYTKLYGNGAIYAITFVDQAIATAAAEHIHARPVTPYDLGALKYDAIARQLEDHSGRRNDDDDFGDGSGSYGHVRR